MLVEDVLKLEELPDDITMEDEYGIAMEITEQEDADRYFEMCVRNNMNTGGHDRVEAERIVRSNIGYWTGYCDSETRRRVERLFRCQHPIFGSIEINGEPTVEEAFFKGMELANMFFGGQGVQWGFGKE